MAESYHNVTIRLKRDWYQFQLDANEVVNELFGEDEDYEVDQLYEKVDEEQDDGVLRPGESNVTIFDVIGDFFEDLWDNLWNSRTTYLRIFKRSIQQQKHQKV